ncbi:MAG: methylmalonyl-CoA epimerase [Planctomycetota bacterium]
MELDHIGIAVPQLEAALPLWRATGAKIGSVETVASQGVRVQFLDTGHSKTELLEPIDDNSPIARFLASGKRGVHHVAYRVDNLDARLAELRAEGVPLIHDEPVPGSRGTRIAFLHPKGTGGVLLELIEYPESAADAPHRKESR